MSDNVDDRHTGESMKQANAEAQKLQALAQKEERRQDPDEWKEEIEKWKLAAEVVDHFAAHSGVVAGIDSEALQDGFVSVRYALRDGPDYLMGAGRQFLQNHGILRSTEEIKHLARLPNEESHLTDLPLSEQGAQDRAGMAASESGGAHRQDNPQQGRDEGEKQPETDFVKPDYEDVKRVEAERCLKEMDRLKEEQNRQLKEMTDSLEKRSFGENKIEEMKLQQQAVFEKQQQTLVDAQQARAERLERLYESPSRLDER